MPMTDDKVISCFAACGKILHHHGICDSVRNGEAVADSQEGHKHLLWLAENGPNLIKEGRREKAMRWLGFLQGGLWGQGVASIEDLKNMNRPDESKFDGGRT